MYRFGALLLAATLFWGCSESSTPVAESEPTTPKISPAEETVSADSAYASLMDESKKAQAEFSDKINNAPPEEQMAMFISGGPRKEMAAKFLDLANQYPDSDVYFKAIKFAAENGAADVATKSYDLIVEKCGDDDKVVGLLENFENTTRMPAQHHEAFLRKLIDESKNDSVKGAATYSLVKLFQNIDTMKSVADDPEAVGMFPKESVEYWVKDRGANFDAELEEMLSSVAEDYADVELGGKKLGKLAEEELFVFKYLSVGKTPPDIEGSDLDGEEFKLSDYRGKVVMLDFWGDW